MNTIHPLSTIAPLPELDLFGVPPTQTSIEKDIYTEIRPVSILSSDAPIQFEFETSENEYLQFRELMLYMTLRVDLKKKDGSDVDATDWSNISPVNYLLHSMFKNIEVEINGKAIVQSPPTYAYKAYFEQIIGFTSDAKKAHLTGSLLVEDNNSNKEALVTNRLQYIKPLIVTKDGRGKIFDLMGKLHLDIAFQERALPGNLKVKITLTPHEPSFYLKMSSTKMDCFVNFLSASLYIHRSRVSNLIVEAHNLALKQSPAKYLLRRSEVKSFTINSGTQSANVDHIKTGILPSRILVAMVTNKAFIGSYDKNPYNFQHFKCNYIACIKDGEQIPAKAYTPNFEEGLYLREYLGLLECLNQLTTDSIVSISRDTYPLGNTIFGFNLVPDLSDGYHMSGHVNPIKRGDLGLEIKFAESLSDTISILVYMEYDSILEIDANREVYLDNVH